VTEESPPRKWSRSHLVVGKLAQLLLAGLMYM